MHVNGCLRQDAFPCFKSNESTPSQNKIQKYLHTTCRKTEKYVCVRNCACPHVFAHVHTEPSLWKIATAALQLLFSYIRKGVWTYNGS